jgi:spore cortex biosynthesis protein YabQ
MLLGVILSVFFDFFMIINKLLKLDRVRVFFSDILFFIFAGLITFLFTIAFNNGEIRFYIMFGELLGAFIYRFLVRNTVIESTVKFLKVKILPIIIFLKNTILKFLLHSLKPFKKALDACKSLLKKILQIFRRVFYNLRNSRKTGKS